MSETVKATIDEFQGKIQAIRSEIQKIIIGQENVVTHVLIGMIAGGHVLLEGVPGLGKTMLVRTLGQVLKLEFSRIQFTPDMMPADITGTEILEDTQHGGRQFRFQSGPIFANLILADEINRATPKTQSALLEAMQEKTVTSGNHTYVLPTPFFVMATQNPIEQEGTYPLPEAQLDRFIFKVNVPFPSEEELSEILTRTTGELQDPAGQAATGENILGMQTLARQIAIASDVSDYASRLIVATHPGKSPVTKVNQYVRYGASPRGGQALIIGAKVKALMNGRYNAGYEDIQSLAPAALRHRLLLNFEGQAAGVRVEEIIEDLIDVVSNGRAH